MFTISKSNFEVLKKEISNLEVFYFLTLGFSLIAFLGNIPLTVSVPLFFIYFFVLVFGEKIKTKSILLNVLIFFIFAFLCEGVIFCYFFFPIFLFFLLFILVIRSMQK